MNIATESRLDTNTALELEQALKDCMDAATELTLDFAVLECISSAGLRLLLFARKTMNKMRTTFSMDFMMCRQCICR